MIVIIIYMIYNNNVYDIHVFKACLWCLYLCVQQMTGMCSP